MTDADGSSRYSNSSIHSSLLQLVRENDEAAWQKVVDLYGRLVYWWCRTAAVPQDEAADVAQEVFVSVAKSISGFDRSQPGQTFRGWLRSITRSKIADFWRRHSQTPKAAGVSLEHLQADSPNDSCPQPKHETLVLYRKVVEFVRGEFSEKDWQAFYLYSISERDAKDVAEQLGISQNQVYLAKSRINRRILAEFDGTEPT